MTGPVWNGDGKDPWLPQRLERRLDVLATERDIRDTFWAQLSDWLIRLSRRVLRGNRPPDLDAVWAMQPSWREAVDLVIARAIAPAMRKGYEAIFGRDYPWDQRVFVARYLAEVRNRLARTPDEVFDLIAGQVSIGVNMGESIPKLSARIDETLSTTGTPRWQNRAVVVARTEAIGALNAGRHDAFTAFDEEGDEELERVWLSTSDSRTRPTHREADQQRVPMGQPFSVGGFDLAFPGDPTGPPQEIIQCVIGSTQVDWPGQAIQGSTSRIQDGPFVQLITAEGHDLTVTPNHPVLTPEGYVPAGLLRPGKSVLASSNSESPDVDHVPTSAEQVHGALRKAGHAERVMGTRMDFHGDGANSEVEVVGAYGHLPEDPNTHRLGQLQKLALFGSSNRKAPLSGLGAAVVLRQPIPGHPLMRTTRSLVSRPSQRAPFRSGHSAESESVGLTAGSDFQAQLIQAPDDGRTAESDFPAHLQYALAAGMAPAEIVQVNRFTGSHRVYNLSTSDHWFTGNGIALHNCRCTNLLVEVGESVDLSNRQFKG